jgi:hypothetical protein
MVTEMDFCVLGQATMNAINFWIFWNFLRLKIWMVAFQQAIACNIWTHGWKLWDFEDFSPSSGMLSATVNAGKSAQNCQNLQKFAKMCPKMKLWNSAKNRDFSVFQKQKFLRVEEALEHVSSIQNFNPRIFHMLFLLSKNGLCMWISAYPYAEKKNFGNPPQLWWIWDFAHMYLTQLGTRFWSPASHI